MAQEQPWPPRKLPGEDDWAWKERLDLEVAQQLQSLDRRLEEGDPTVIAMVQQAELDQAFPEMYSSLLFGPVVDAYELEVPELPEWAMGEVPPVPDLEQMVLRVHEMDFALLDGDPDAIRAHVDTEIATWTVNQLRREDI